MSTKFLAVRGYLCEKSVFTYNISDEWTLLWCAIFAGAHGVYATFSVKFKTQRAKSPVCYTYTINFYDILKIAAHKNATTTKNIDI